MEKIFSFKKEVLFKNNIEEILSMALDKNLDIEGNAVKGLFVISGEYSTYNNKKDKFEFEVPYVDYLDECYDTSCANADIDDFYYEVVGKNKVAINIDVKISKLTEIEKEEEIILDDLDDNIRESIDLDDIEEIEEIKEDDIDMSNNIVNNVPIKEDSITPNDDTSIFNIGTNMSDTYTTYKVYIIRDGDTIESLTEKYNVSKEILVQYNNLNDIKIGDKIIIPNEAN